MCQYCFDIQESYKIWIWALLYYKIVTVLHFLCWIQSHNYHLKYLNSLDYRWVAFSHCENAETW